ncbi:lytic polysaccharide monooxygenase [Streptomyces sp. MT29]|nr:lytic polysaccharide monooxygenase [Streptomyces sp. MT29]
MKKIKFPVAAAVLVLAALVPQSAAATGPEQAVATDTVSSRSAATQQLDITPASRQSIYLYGDQVGVRGGKFINTTIGGQSDRDVPSDIVNRTPPPDGQIASAGNPYASKLDGVRDEYGNEWKTHSVRNGEAMTVSLRGLDATKIRRVSAYMTKANWDPSQGLARAQFDLDNQAYTHTYNCAPYYQCDDELPWGLRPSNPHEFSVNLPYRSVGHHVLLLEIDHPDSGDATYQVVDLRYVN